MGQLRPHLAQHPGDPRGPELDALTVASPKFARLWAEHEVQGFHASRKKFRHPVAGLLSLDYVKLAAASNDQQYLITILPADKATAEKLRHLG